MKIQVTSLLALAFVTVACSKKDSDVAASTGSFLKPSDFSNLSYDQITLPDALNQLKDSSEIYDNQPSGGSSPAGDRGGAGNNTAIDTCMKNNQPKVNVVDKSTINVDANVDILQCLKEQSGGASGSTEASQFAVRYVFNISCPGADFSDLQGKKLDEVGISQDDPLSNVIESKCKNADSFKTFVNASFELRSAVSDAQAIEMSLKVAQFAKDGTACTHTKVAAGYQTDGCLNMSYSAVNFGGQSKKELSVFEASNLVNSLASTATWFAAGSFKLTLNNATGTLTYTGESAAPSYSLTGSGQTITGTLDSSEQTLESFQSRTLPADFLSRQVAQLTHQAVDAWNRQR